MNPILKFSLCLFLTILIITSCKKDNNDVTPNPDAGKLPVNETLTSISGDSFGKMEGQYSSLNEAIYYSFRDFYLWNETLPTNLNYNSYSADALLDLLKKTNTYDRWSFVTDKAEGDALFEEGTAYGKGFLLGFNELDATIRIALVYSQSSAGAANLYRGLIAEKVNGKSILDLLRLNDNYASFDAEFSKSTINLKLIDSVGVAKDVRLTDGTIKIKTVLHQEVKNIDGKKVGYMVFNSFLGPSQQELTNTFAYFKGQGISELILDLRYNGGGYIYIAQQLASLIAGSKVTKNDVFIIERFNKNYSIYNDTVYFEDLPNKLDLDRVFIIGSSNTASASELVINGLKPYMQVVLIGDKTHGKPVGFFPFTYKEKQIYPVSLESVNKLGEGKYYTGIVPNVYKYDGTQYPFGDPREFCIKEALYYIENGSASGTSQGARIEEFTAKMPERKGLRQISGVR